MTDRLGFSTWKEGDEPLALTLWGITEVSALIGGPFTTAEIHARLRREIDTMNAHKVQYWPVFSLQNNELAGCAGLRPYGSGEDVFELGVHLRPSYWGQGIALEAARAVIAYAFEHMGSQKPVRRASPGKLGIGKTSSEAWIFFTHEEFYPPTGRNHPSYLLVNSGHSS
jgi:[ribosomal protein S5]-alanine N-acetyltransferase